VERYAECGGVDGSRGRQRGLGRQKDDGKIGKTRMKNRIIKKTMMMVETLIPKQERRWDLDVMVMTGWKENRR
jgi:hypothetical protein